LLESGESRFNVTIKTRKRASRDGGEMMICSDISIQRKMRGEAFLVHGQQIDVIAELTPTPLH
jgi:hypothetical protein